MKHLALLALADAEVDLLTRLAQRSDLTLSAVYHPDPHSLVARLAELANVPVYTDLEALADLPLDCCLGNERSRPLIEALAGHAAAAGRERPAFVSIAESERFLEDPIGWSSPVTALDLEIADDQPPDERVQTELPTGSPETPSPVDIESTSVMTEPVRVRRTLGAPTIDLFYEPSRLAEWLVQSALRLTGAESAVLWRRETNGLRWTLMAFAPDADRLPAVTFPPEELEAEVQSGLSRSGPLGDGSGVGLEPPVRALYVPLPGAGEPFGLLALFQPWSAPEWPKFVRDELSARAGELGGALERCLAMSKVGQELKHLKFKERLRDCLLSDTLAPADRWRLCLEFLLEELPAQAAWYFAADESAARLRLVAAVSISGPIEGELSLPMGTGLIGHSFGGTAPTRWFGEAGLGAGEMVTIPVEGGRGGHRTPAGVLLIEGVPSVDEETLDAGQRIDILRDILAPLISSTAGE
ncbi:MAG: hypothetical protein SGI90_07090 [Candidatus Eisenbacteria bacterium]|nr:hypothetical protein [Candidatus Eisenbacteria bacterium]